MAASSQIFADFAAENGVGGHINWSVRRLSTKYIVDSISSRSPSERFNPENPYLGLYEPEYAWSYKLNLSVNDSSQVAHRTEQVTVRIEENYV